MCGAGTSNPANNWQFRIFVVIAIMGNSSVERRASCGTKNRRFDAKNSVTKEVF